MIDLVILAQECAPSVPIKLIHSLVRKESAFKPFAIGMDSKFGVVKQPETLAEALETVKKLKRDGRKFSVGLAQIHVSNVELFNLSWEQAFDPCTNLHTGELILNEFYNKAISFGYKDTSALWAMLRGYNCGNINCSVSNQYASDILKYANLITDQDVSVKMNYAVKKSDEEVVAINVEEKEQEKDFFSNNQEAQKDFFSNNQ